MRPLLAVDGDSFAHRAYHGLPKTIRLNAVVGFANMLVGLWEAEQPRAVLVGWDTLTTPTYRHEAFEAYRQEHKGTKVSRADADALKAQRDRGAACLDRLATPPG